MAGSDAGTPIEDDCRSCCCSVWTETPRFLLCPLPMARKICLGLRYVAQ